MSWHRDLLSQLQDPPASPVLIFDHESPHGCRLRLEARPDGCFDAYAWCRHGNQAIYLACPTAEGAVEGPLGWFREDGDHWLWWQQARQAAIMVDFARRVRRGMMN